MKQPLALEAAALAFWVPQKNGAEDGDILTPCLNSVSLIKFVGADPEQRQAQNNGAKFAVLSVATQRSWKDSNDEWQSRTEWHRVCVIWNLNGRQVEGVLVMPKCDYRVNSSRVARRYPACQSCSTQQN